MTTHATTTQDLIEAAQRGDQAALNALLEREQARIYRYGMRLCGRRTELAEEVLQETLLTMVEKLKDFRGESRLSTWAYTIARSHCRRERRREGPAERSDAEPLADPGVDPDRAVLARERVRMIERALLELEPAQREVVVLRDVEGLDTLETAVVTGASEAAVKGRLHRGRERLRRLLAADPDAELTAVLAEHAPRPPRPEPAVRRASERALSLWRTA